MENSEIRQQVIRYVHSDEQVKVSQVRCTIADLFATTHDHEKRADEK